MRNILGISASRRVWGNCETAVKQVLAAAAAAGARVTFIRLADMDIRTCKGCFRCVGEKGRCPIEDDLYDFLDSVKTADDIVLASPVYFMAAPAALVGLMDRLLTVNAYMERGDARRHAVTLTLMGNQAWRGVAEPFVNLTASLLGFEILDSLSLVAEGPAEVLSRPEVGESLAEAGRLLAGGEPPRPGEAGCFCPVCRSDFFRLEPPHVVCPVCGLKGDLETYAASGVLRPTDDPPRWGQAWLAGHIDSWIRPSLTRYAGERKEVLRNLRTLKAKYRAIEERGKPDVP
jgi:putative NADPH-quinone reductase